VLIALALIFSSSPIYGTALKRRWGDEFHRNEDIAVIGMGLAFSGNHRSACNVRIARSIFTVVITLATP